MSRRRAKPQPLDGALLPGLLVLAALLVGGIYLVDQTEGMILLVIPAIWWWRWKLKRKRNLEQQRALQERDRRLQSEASERAHDLRARMTTLGGMLAMTPREFEVAIGDLLARQGFTEVQRVGSSGDLAVDVRCKAPDGRRVVVQCKRYGPGNNIGSGDIQKFVGMIHVHQADIGIFVTTAGFTAPARELAARTGVRLIGGEELALWSRLADEDEGPRFLQT